MLLPTLLRLHDRFELDLCGEGGEYETLVLDSRAFRRRLVLTETTIDYDQEDDAVGCLRVISCETVEKEEGECRRRQSSRGESERTGVPSCPDKLVAPLAFNSAFSPVKLPPLVFGRDGLCQTGLLLFSSEPALSSSAGEQLRGLLEGLSRALDQAGGTLRDLVFVHLYVARMSDFQAVNDQYGGWFGSNPPSRSCLQVCSAHCAKCIS